MTASNLIQALKFYRNALTINRIHSPFYFELCSYILDLSKEYTGDYKIETHRNGLLKDKKNISFKDLGSGSRGKKMPGMTTRTISSIARNATSPKRKCRLLRNLVLYFKPKQILELGSNLGIMTAYLHHASPKTPIISVEGAKPIFEYALETIRQLAINDSVQLFNLDFQTFFRQNKSVIDNSDFIYLDGDHSFEGTISYIRQLWVDAAGLNHKYKVIVIDDIYWSVGMTKAWEEICTWEGCNTLDLYQLGIVIISKSPYQPKHLKCVTRIAKPWQFGFWG